MKNILFILFCLLSLNGFSQITSELIVREGDLFFENAQYIRAITNYKAALDENSTYVKAKYMLAECYRLTQEYESAEFYYQEIAESGGDTRFPLAGFYYGLMQKLKGNYNDALSTFNTFEEFLVSNSFHENDEFRYFYKQSKIEIDGCQLAINQITLEHEDHQFELLDAPLNSEFNDYAAFTLGTDSILCLTSARKGGKGSLVDYQFGEGLADLFRFVKDESGWQEYDNDDRFENMINTKWGDGSGSFNQDRTKFYYTNCHEDIGEVCHIYSSSFVNGKWSEPVPLNFNINEYGFNSKHPQLSPGGDTLFFVSDREGGIGGLDIWMSLNAGGENWGTPSHLGDQINTPFNEVSPFYDEIQKVLFFASEGHRGFGGYDIYIARGSRFDAAEIYNAGIPFNSNMDDIFFFLGNKKGYLSSNRDEGIGKFDIYSFGIKSKEEIINILSNEETLAGRNSLFTDDYNFDNRNTDIINQIISRKLSSSISNMELVLTSEQLKVYNSLSLDDKERIEKIVNARVRKMTAGMMRSIRSEDDFFYQQMETNKRRKVDDVVTKYVEQQAMGLSVFLPQETSSFYSDVATDEREKLDVFITERLNDAQKIKHQPINYYAFAEPDRQKIDGIAIKYLSEKKNLGSLQLGVNERAFLNRIDDSQKARLDVAVREKLLTLSEEKSYQLRDQDRAFYERLSWEEKESIKGIASAFLLADLNTFENLLNASDLEVFKYKDAKGTQTLDKLLLKQISNLMKASMYIAETSFTPEELRSLEGATVEESLAELYRINSKLTSEDKLALERFVKTTFQSYLISRKPAFTPSIPLTAVAPSPSKSAKEKDPTAVLNSDVLNQYASMPASRRWLVDKIIGLDYLSAAYSNDPQLKSQDEASLRSSSALEKTYFEILSKNMRHEPLNSSENALLLEAFTYYNNLAPSRKALVNRMVLTKTFNQRNGKFILTPKDGALRARLNPEELDLIATLKKFRLNNERVLTENLAVEAKDTDPAPVDVIALVNDKKLSNEKDEEDRIAMESSNGNPESATAEKMEMEPSKANTESAAAEKIVGEPSNANPESATAKKMEVASSNTNLESTTAEKMEGEPSNTNPESATAEKMEVEPSKANTESAAAEKIVGEPSNANPESATTKKMEGASSNTNPESTTAEKMEGEPSNTNPESAAAVKIGDGSSNTNLESATAKKMQGEPSNIDLESATAKKMQVEPSNANPESAATKKMEVASSNTNLESATAKKMEEEPSITNPESATAKKMQGEPSNADIKNPVAKKIEVVFTPAKKEVEVAMPNYNYTGFEEIAISGKLLNSATNRPLSSHKVRLLRQDQSKTVIEGITNNLGYFSFKVPADTYLISLSSESDEGAISVEDFEMSGNFQKNEGLFEADTRAYFNSASYELRPETMVMLDQIIDWAKGKSVSIELESHTDNLGNEEYNVNLSKNRGYATRDYLVENGIPESNISVVWHGFENPISANDNPIGRQLNRRMDIWITSSNPEDELNLGQYFLARPNVSLYAIARTFNLTVDELKRMNGLVSNSISEFAPIRIVSSKKLDPDLSLVVPADFNIVTDFRYTVQPGDDVIKLARKFNVPEEIILELNGLSSMKLIPGTKIKIYPGD